MLEGNFDSFPEIPTLRPHFILEGIFLSLEFAIICAVCISDLFKLESLTNLLKLIFNNLESKLLIFSIF